MYILQSIKDTDKKQIEAGNKTLLKLKLQAEYDKWHKSLLMSKEDQRFHQGICCTLLDILTLLN